MLIDLKYDEQQSTMFKFVQRLCSSWSSEMRICTLRQATAAKGGEQDPTERRQACC